MSDEDNGSPELDILAREHALELELKEYDWAQKPQQIQLSIDELKHALAVLSVLETDEDDDDEALVWIH